MIHKFIFFSKDGKSIGTQSFETKKFFKKIIFKPITSEDKYFSFIHYVESSKSLMKILKDNGISNSLNYLSKMKMVFDLLPQLIRLLEVLFMVISEV